MDGPDGLTIRCLHLVRHLAALGFAAAAGFGAGLAVGHVVGVFFALGGTGGANIGAKLHVLLHKLRPPRFQPATKCTDIGAVAAELDAQGHVVVFAVLIAHVEAGSGAAFAGLDTLKTSVGVAVGVIHRFHNRR